MSEKKSKKEALNNLIVQQSFAETTFEFDGTYFNFKTNMGLTEPIQVTAIGVRTQFSLHQYTQDIAIFINSWTEDIKPRLEDFKGFFGNVRFVPIGFTLI